MVAQIVEEITDGVAVLRLDRPVANALGPQMRGELRAALDRAVQDPAVSAIVLAGAGAGFSSGVDLTEFDGPLASPTVGELCNAVEDAPKPVVAALHGAVFGAALALALAAHARVAQSGARLALPEITLGMIPGGGVTQRAPRLLGAQVSLELMLTGQPARAGDPRLRRLFAEVVETSPEAVACAHARELAATGQWMRSCETERGFSDPAGYQRAIATVTDHLGGAGRGGAGRDILRAIEAAHLLPFAQGLALEETLFEERLHSPEARAQRHVHAAERRAGGMPELRHGTARTVRHVAVHGAVPVHVALLLLRAGRTLSTDSAPLAQAVHEALEADMARGRLTEAQRADQIARLNPAGPPSHPDLQLLVRAETDDASAGGVVLDTGEGLAGAMLGLRFFGPVTRPRVAEIAVSDGTDPDDVATLARLCADLRVTPVRAALPAAGPGLGHVMMGALCLAALHLVRAGMTPLAVDEAAGRLGLRTGPLLWMDGEGLTLVAERLASVADWLGDAALGRDDVLAERLAKGATGRAVGRGFYDHPPEGPRAPKGLAASGRDPEEVLGGVCATRALHAALVGAALRLIERGAVQRASDLDLIMVRGSGYARARGGPLMAADQRGLLAVLNDMKALSPLAPALWAVPDALLDMVKNGEGFFGRAAASAAS